MEGLHGQKKQMTNTNNGANIKKINDKNPRNPFSINIFKNKLCAFADITILSCIGTVIGYT